MIKKFKINIFCIYIIRILLLLGIIYLYTHTFRISSYNLIMIFFGLITLFCLSSLIYYSFYENIEDRKLLINIWKIYIPSIVVLLSILFAIDKYNLNNKIDYYKTKIDYFSKIDNKEEMKIIFKEYSEIVEKDINFFSKKELEKFDKTYSDNKQEEKEYIIGYINFITNIMNILTLIMFLRSFIELSKFVI
ncbi:hypothetical protein L5F33_10110 [Aliarcobacter butzleri]|uniref:hypothetical protein n=1 Tax=Aliarcobacter butzleri TaxID=28197 RepID=UPI001EDFC607|nr:hypothetical protein [Aliarcobacter butzleri]MCG3670620.1 hypothetical protein [Aliarcobacter butzleri]